VAEALEVASEEAQGVAVFQAAAVGNSWGKLLAFPEASWAVARSGGRTSWAWAALPWAEEQIPSEAAAGGKTHRAEEARRRRGTWEEQKGHQRAFAGEGAERTAVEAEAELAAGAASALPFQAVVEEAGSVQIEVEVVFGLADLRFPLVGAVAIAAVALAGPAVWARLRPAGRRRGLAERCQRCCP